jgi:DNA-binding MarR family transcriptional regulator
LKKERFQRITRLFCQAVLFRILKPALDELTKQDLTQVQLSCIRFVRQHPEPSVGMIADGLGVSNAAAAKLTDRLVKKGFLTREEDPHDRRVLKIKLNPEGLKLLEKVCYLESEFFTSILERMTPESLTKLEQGMEAFLKAALNNPEQIDEICLKCGWNHQLDCPGNIRYRELTGHDKEKV